MFDNFDIENQLLQYSPGCEWVYASNQQVDEAWVFLQADMNADGLSGRSDLRAAVADDDGDDDGSLCCGLGVPHTSFLHPDHKQALFPRESIEVRAIVYYEDEDEENCTT